MEKGGKGRRKCGEKRGRPEKGPQGGKQV